MRRYEITDQQWTKIAVLLPAKVREVGRSATDKRLFINAVLWIARSGAPGATYPNALVLPLTYPSARTRLIAGSGAGISQGQNVFESLQEPDLDWLMIDATVVHSGSWNESVTLPAKLLVVYVKEKNKTNYIPEKK